MRKSFTLLELLIVIIIIGILAVIAIPSFFQAADRAKEAKAKDVLNNIARIAVQYRSVYGRWPAAGVRRIAIDLDLNDGVATEDVVFEIPQNDPDYRYAIADGSATATSIGGGA
ncbi:MAG: prepilin-type N-terminal cleavage/methylation domain-containing protein, partial [Candidatus Omnitrophica bacterium]|nr:prepilin-type N-terminal cleavage/methylation domain-containing protein [Candidatus Omnitrophota bacterium]